MNFKLIITIAISCLSILSAHPDNIKTVIHLNSDLSEGAYSPKQIAAFAAKYGIGAIAFTDRDLQKWEYGLWPLRNILKKTVEDRSILKTGPKDYLQNLSQLQNDFPDITIIPGTESAPFYYWQLSLPGPDLTMYDWHKHIITLGLFEPDDYTNLPVVGNWRALRDRFDPIAILLPIMIVIAAFIMQKTKKKISIILFLAGIVLFINNYPFKTVKFDQYHKNPKISPYQNYIDYANRHNALTFWAHPEATDISHIGKIEFVTQKHNRMLASTTNYTGFSAFYEGYNETAIPGGLWDDLLLEFVTGKYPTPIFTIGGMALDKGKDIQERIKDLQTIVDSPSNDARSILAAMKKGHMYTAQGKYSLQFDMPQYYAYDGKQKAVSGEALFTKHPFYLKLKCSFTTGPRKIRLKIITNGQVIDERSCMTPLDFDFQAPPSEKPSYYRAEIISEGLHVITNPIFINPKQTKRKG